MRFHVSLGDLLVTYFSPIMYHEEAPIVHGLPMWTLLDRKSNPHQQPKDLPSAGFAGPKP